ncbi:MAG: PD-(D/E)XK nuclease family protein [Saprospiraceae bacterium]|nr:PD-(D/E)XK nuclease family protein [Saprospiraceae bacterium]
MNIFKILANGDGTLNEANISAFLGYLLNPYQDHGLGFEFLSRFLELLQIEEFNPSKFDYGVYFEQAFREKDKSKKIVDIVLLCFESSLGDKKESFVTNILKTSKKLKYIFLIENKINESSKKSNQLDEQFNSTKKELGIEEEKIYSIYVTPEKESLKKEFDSFKSNNKFHIYWNTKDQENEKYSLWFA